MCLELSASAIHKPRENARNSWHDSKYRLLRSSWDTQTCWFNLTVVFEAVSVGYVPFALSLMQFLLCLSRRPDDSLHLPAVDYCNSQRQLSESFVQNPRKPHGDKPALHERWNHSGEAFCCDEKHTDSLLLENKGECCRCIKTCSSVCTDHHRSQLCFPDRQSQFVQGKSHVSEHINVSAEGRHLLLIMRTAFTVQQYHPLVFYKKNQQTN